MEKHNRIAYCIPTYNRPIQVDGVLSNLLPLLNKYGIDIYVYDSSSNNETEIVSEKYKSYENFYYIKLSSETNPFEKTKLIFTGVHQIREYDYVWLVKDRGFSSEDLIKRIINAVDSDPDAVFLRAIETTHTLDITRDHYDDPVLLYHDWGWLTTSWDVLLLSRKNILDKVNWDEIENRYSVDVEWDKIITTSTVKKDLSFILVVLLFDTLGKKEKCSVPVLDAAAGTHIFNLPLTERKIEKWLFDVWGYEWYHVNTNLPDVYNDEKEFVIKSVTSLPWIMGDYIKFINLWHDGCLTDKTLAKVEDIWDKISDIPWQDVCRIKDGNRAFIEKLYTDFIWALIEKNDMDYVIYCYNTTLWIKDGIITKDLQYTIYAIEIYLSEKQNNDICIFNGGYTREFVFAKIELVIKFLQAIEKYAGIQSQEIKNCIYNKLISSSMIEYLIINCCENVKIVFERINDFLCEDGGFDGFIKKQLACIYMTHNHPEMANIVLSHICDSYRDRGIDIIYYDSSDDDGIQKIVEQYNLKGYSNIYYVDMRFTNFPDEKFIYMLKKYGFPKQYDYIWNSKDRCFFKGETLDKIVESVQEGHDVVFALYEGDRWEVRMPDVKDIYTDSVEFFSHYGQLTTNWECLIRKTETMIDPVNWDEFIPKYNMANDKSFNQTISLFSRLSEMNNYSIKVVHTDYNDKIYASNIDSGWRSMIFDVWIDQWVKAIYSLPAIYDPYKLKIIKAETGIPSLFGSVDGMIAHKINGILTKEVFEKYRPMWNLVTDFPEEFVDMILDEKYNELFAIIINLFDKSFAEHNYDLAYRIFMTNEWMKNYCEESLYNDMSICFGVYKAELNDYGSSKLFDGVSSPQDLIDKYILLKPFIPSQENTTE